MLKLSAVIITFNEEKNIARCINSLKDVADEILVVDSFSTDKTKEICESYKVRFIENKFEGHIQQKNFAADQAEHEYILSLDADEALSDTLKKNIIDVKKDFTFDAYAFNRFNNFCGVWIKHGGWYPDTKIRLWKKGKGKWTGENPHDRFELNEKANKGFIKGNLLHYSFYTIEQHIETINKFSTIAAKARYSKGKKTNILRILFKPLIKFITLYIVRLGILDGYYGFVIAASSAYSTYLKEIKLKYLHQNKF